METNGILGWKGERGYSAYQIAVKNGYEGTEQEWIDHFGLDLTGYLQTADVIDDLTSEYTTRPLSANQGKVLNNAITWNRTQIQNLMVSTVSEEDLYEVSGTMDGSQIGTNYYTMVGEVSYPDGFTKDNTYVIGSKINIPSSSSSGLGSGWYECPILVFDFGNGRVCDAYSTIKLADSKIYIYFTTSQNITGETWNFKMELIKR